jgi:hypothetical protein
VPIPNSAAATYSAQADVDSLDLDIIQAGVNGTGVTSGCACTPASSGSTLGVAVASGTALVAGTPVTVTSGTVTPGAAHASLARFDLVVVNNAGTKSVVAGTAASTPVFPAAAPATYAVLAAVYIPATVTSITAGNIVDKRQLVATDTAAATPALRTLGTTSTQAAAGDHLHAGQYASTAHAATHGTTGSDPLATDIAPTDIHPIHQISQDGTGYVHQKVQTTTPTSPMSTEQELMTWAKGIAWRATPVHRSYWRSVETPTDALWGISNRMAIYPGTSTTPEKFGAPFTSTGTISHPSPTVANGFHMNLATAASANATISIASTDTRWVVGDAAWPWTGLWMMAEVLFPDSSYANSGASTGSRFFVGFTDQSVATMLGSDSPVGHRFGFRYVNVNGGVTDTNFQVVTRDGTTQTATNTSVALAQNKWYRFWLHIQPNYLSFASVYAQIDNITDGTVAYAPSPISANVPGATTFMRAMIGLQTINATARNVKMHTLAVEAPVD